MNALTTDAIRLLEEDTSPIGIFHSTAIAYIQSLLKPYAEAIQDAQSIESIKEWIPLAYHGGLSGDALDAIEERTHIDRTIGYDQPEILAAVKTEAIEFLVNKLLFGTVFTHRDFQILFPWEIETTISKDENLSQMFGIVPGSDTLPVSVTVGVDEFVHLLTKEFTFGILALSITANVSFKIAMFGEKLTRDFFMKAVVDAGLFEYDERIFTHFTVKTLGQHYAFNTPDFMQGFTTGASWVNVNHHDYWSELMQVELDGVERVETPITF